jgi:hypothetical protein
MPSSFPYRIKKRRDKTVPLQIEFHPELQDTARERSPHGAQTASEKCTPPPTGIGFPYFPHIEKITGEREGVKGEKSKAAQPQHGTGYDR